MRILYLSQYFPPEIGATQIRAYEMARGLLQAGHQVTMLTEVPNHPQGIIQPPYRRRAWAREPLDGIDVIRVWVRTTPIKTLRTRLMFYASYAGMASLAGLLLARGRYDIIYCTSPPLTVGAAGLLLSLARRLPLVFEVRDLWPESAVTLGELTNPRFINWATRLEEACYNRARHIVVTSNETRRRLLERGLTEEKLSVIYNGASTRMYFPDVAARRRVRAELQVKDDTYLVLYAGLHGVIYDLEAIVDAAIALKETVSLRFVLVGDGPTKARVQAYAAAQGADNVQFLPPQPREVIPDYFNAADLTVAPLRQDHAFGSLPTKMYDSMACGVPVVAAAHGETAAILAEAGGGLAVPPGDHRAFAQAIASLLADPGQRRQMADQGRTAVAARFSREAQAANLVTLLERLHAGLSPS